MGFHHAVSEARHHHQRGRFEAGIKIYRGTTRHRRAVGADVEASSIKAVETGATKGPRWCFGTYPLCGRHLISTFICRAAACCYPYPEVQYVMRYRKRTPKLTYRSEIKAKWVREGTYGGKLVENIVQAIARDLISTRAQRRARRVQGHRHRATTN